MATCHGNTVSFSTVEGKAAMARPTRNGEARGENTTTSLFYLISQSGGMCSMALSILSFLGFQLVIFLC